MEPSPLVPTRSRAAIGGWVCFGIGLATFWIFGLGLLFLLAAFITGIIALVTNPEVRSNVALVVSSAVSVLACGVLAFVLAPFLFVAAVTYHFHHELKDFGQYGTVVPSHSLFSQNRYIRTQSEKSADGETFLVVENNSGNCQRILIDGKPWTHPIHVGGQIDPGTHTISCEGHQPTLDFTIDAGKTLYVEEWKP